MAKLPNHTALKEWSTVVSALGRGEQVILIRKGGLADPRFGVEADRFYLYPTFFHEAHAAGEPDSVPITHWCEVVRSWRVTAMESLRALAPQVVMPWETLETRYRFRSDQALHVIGVRTHALPAPVAIRVTPEYEGCRSWISIDDEIDVKDSRAVHDADSLEERFREIDSLLAESAQNF